MSTIKADNIATLAGVSTSMANAVNGSAKAWVNFNGAGTVAINASYNVSSITDNGTGDYTLNFTNAMANTNYLVVPQSMTYASNNYNPTVLALRNGGGGPSSLPTGKNTTSVRVVGTYGTAGGSLIDIGHCGVAVYL